MQTDGKYDNNPECICTFLQVETSQDSYSYFNKLHSSVRLPHNPWRLFLLVNLNIGNINGYINYGLTSF